VQIYITIQTEKDNNDNRKRIALTKLNFRQQSWTWDK